MAAHTDRKFFRRCTCCAEPSTLVAAPIDRRAFMAGGLAAFGAGLAGTGAPTPALAGRLGGQSAPHRHPSPLLAAAMDRIRQRARTPPAGERRLDAGEIDRRHG